MKFSTITLVTLATWVLKKTRQDYESRGELSIEASMGGWVLYLTHLFATLAAVLSSTEKLPSRQNPSTALGGALALIGSWFYIAAMQEFRSFEQMSGTETGNLVTSGPYRYSRNPQVVGWGLVLLDASIAGRSSKALLLVVAFFLIHRLYFVAEEQHLERTFGEEYRRYRSNTPRFLDFPEE